MGLNDHLPANINVLSVQNAHPRFHARHSAVSRSYLYLIALRRTAFGKKYVWWVRDKLHMDKMRKALSVFKGFHDFTSFADKRMEKNSSTKVLVESIELKEFNSLMAVRITGSHFLWKMVRRIVGMTVEAGRGNISARELEQMLVAVSDVPARHTAPPSGLFLEKVLYEGDKLPPIQPPIHLL
jgi:tRNA pseudouridine38-40 synthase